jgi:hypothetical protein
MLDRDLLIQDIGTLMSAPLNGDRAARLASIERTLTDGYAVALALEGERLRLERRKEEITHSISADVEGHGLSGELSDLIDRMQETDGDLAKLRGLLAALRRHAETFRAA